MSTPKTSRRAGTALGALLALAGAGGVCFGMITLVTAPGTATHEVTIHVDDSVPFAVVDTASFGSVTDRLELRVSDGATDALPSFAATARPVDALAWLEGVPAVSLSLGADGAVDEALAAGSAVGSVAGASTPDPRGADVWAVEHADVATTPIAIDLTDPAAIRASAVVLAGGGTGSSPSAVTLSWVGPADRPWAVPLTAVGAGVAAVGLVVVLRFARDRRGRGGQRGRSGGAAAAAVLAVLAVGAAGAASATDPAVAAPVLSPSANPSAAPSAIPSSPPSPAVSVTDAQAARILDRVASVVGAADAAADPERAAERLAGSALITRTAGYTIAASGTDVAPTVIAAGDVAVTLPEVTEDWPRRLGAVVESGGSDDPEQPGTGTTTALLLVQESAREPYRVVSAVAIGQGKAFPPLPASSSGASVLDPTSMAADLRVPLAELGARYEDVLDLGTTSDDATVFDRNGDIFRAQVGYEYRQRAREITDKRASVDFTSEAGASGTTAFATTDGGALAWVTLRDSEVVTPQDTVESGDIAVIGAAAALSGVSSSATGVTTSYEYQLLFAVPPAGSTAPVRTLGFAQGAVAAAVVP